MIIRGYVKQNALLHTQRMETLRLRDVEELLWVERKPKVVNGPSSPEVVLADELAPVLNAWRKRYDLEYDVQYRIGDLQRHGMVCGSIEYLSQESGVPTRRIRAVMTGEAKYMSLTGAELLLEAVDRHYMLATGEIHIVPNPNWSFKKWIRYMMQACYDDGEEEWDAGGVYESSDDGTGAVPVERQPRRTGGSVSGEVVNRLGDTDAD